jgi:Uma2 family endonuclease
MATQTLPETSASALCDRLYQLSPAAYHGLIEHGLVNPDEVAFRDGLLVNASSEEMATACIDRLYRIPLDVYDGMARLGLLTKHDKTVLLDGLLVQKMPKGAPHVTATKLAAKVLEGVVPSGWHVGKEDPIGLPTGPTGHGSEPEPDVAVVRGTIRDYAARHPGPADMALVVEVADSSLRDDRGSLVRYAWAEIPVAWLVNLANGTVEVYSNPTGPVAPALYQESKVYGSGDQIPVVVDGREVGQVTVRDLLP